MSISGVRIKNESGKELYALKEKGPAINFGRDKKVCHITFDPHAARVSRVHASIKWTEEGLFFDDKSKEGTVINGKRLKQSKEELDVGVYELEIGGLAMSIEVEGAELEETVLDSPQIETRGVSEEVREVAPTSMISKTIKREPPLVEVPEEDSDDASSISTFAHLKYNRNFKRKSDASLFNESQPRGKKGKLVQQTMNFDEEMENRVKKVSRARKADANDKFDEETPAKKSKTQSERPVPLTTQRLMKNYFRAKSPSIEGDDGIDSIVSQVAAIPSVSNEPDIKLADDSDHSEARFDRGPAAPNETIKYANLIFHQPDCKKNDTTRLDPTVPNFKRFVPKGLRDGRTSVISMYSNNTSLSTTIRMIDSRKIH